VKRFEREKKTLTAMIAIYCRDKHHTADALCGSCAEIHAYAMARLERCTFGPDKPKCSDCPIHCYKPAMRETIRAIMRHSGPRMLARHPVLALGHTLDGVLHPAPKSARKKP
jgi:hypothetical protein